MSNVSDQEPMKVRTMLKMFSGKSLKPTLILLYAALALSVWRYLPPAPLLAEAATPALSALSSDAAAPPANDWTSFFRGETRILAALLLMGVIPALMVKYVFRERLADYGLRFGNFFTLRSMLLFTPIMILIGYLAAQDSNYLLIYPYNRFINHSTQRLLLHIILFYPILYIVWEFMFRGFMLHGLSDSCGIFNAILISTLASTMLHFGHPLSEVLGSVGGGIFWGFLALRTKSILSGTVQHAAAGITMVWFLVTMQ